MQEPLVLIVDDDPDIRQTLGDLLTRVGYRVEFCSDGLQAWHRFQSASEELSAMVTDLKMPGLSGDQLVLEVRAASPEFPIVVVTSSVGDPRLAALAEVSATEILGKERIQDELHLALGRVIARGRTCRDEKSDRQLRPNESWRGRARLTGLLMASVAAAAFVVIGLVDRPAAPELPTRETSTVARGGVIEVEGPRGELSVSPTSFRWNTVEAADRYQFELWRGANELVFETRTPDNWIDFSQLGLEDFERAVTYRWSVAGIDAEDRIVAESPVSSFRIFTTTNDGEDH